MKFKRLFAAVLAVVMVGVNVFNGVLPVMAAEGDDPTVRNPEPYHVQDGDEDPTNDVVLYKTAESVPGYANKWKVTLKIEAPKITVTSDTVLVIDSSWSMLGDPLDEAKTAAKALVSRLLPESNLSNKINRVAVYSYDEHVHPIIGFSYDGTAVADAIDTISADHGTYTQGGLHTAVNLIADSQATYKNIVLLSDGEPNYSCRIDNPYSPDDYLINGGAGEHTNEKQTGTSIPEVAFGDCAHSVGRSSPSMYYQYKTTGNGANTTYYYYNHGNSAIAEALNFRNSSGGTLYTIMFETGAGDNGATVLSDMAGTGHFYHSETASLNTIFQQIAGKIMDQVNSAHVHDVMGDGVVVEDAQHHQDTMLDWNDIDFEFDNTIGKYVASYSYEVEAGEHILDADSPDGFHPLNKDATLTYTDKDGNPQEEPFPVPYVKPFFINVTKEVVGQTCAVGECVFDFKIEHPAGAKTTTYTVEAGKTHSIVESFPIGNYTLTETGTNSGNPVKFENYLVSYTGNQFTIAEQHADHIDIKITNTYETKSETATKVWSDENDRDGIRYKYNKFYAVAKDADGDIMGYTALTTDGGDYVISDLPMYYNGTDATYTIVEATDCSTNSSGVKSCTEVTGDEAGYTPSVSGNTITNTHVPEKVDLLIKKSWVGKDKLPNAITVNVSGGGYSENITITANDKVEGECTSWCKSVTGLYKYENKGQEIEYKAKEVNAVWAQSEGFIEYGADTTEDGAKSVEGRWDASEANNDDVWTVTNTWVPAEFIYNGATDFKVKKIDKNGNPLAGVVFSINGEEIATDESGVITIEIPTNLLTRDEVKEFEIYEISTLEGYDLDGDTANLSVAIESALESVNETTLTNNYAKKFTFTVSGNNNYTWNKDQRMLILKNKRSEAKSLMIEKNYTGVSEDELRASDLSFILSGPDDFEEMAIAIAEFAFADGVATFELMNLPTGEYTVSESGGEIDGYTMEIEGESECVVVMKKGEEETVSFTNVYELIPEPEPEPEPEPVVGPCELGGCGGMIVPEPELPAEAPNTGRMTKSSDYVGVSNMVATVAGTVACLVVMFSLARRKEQKLTK